MHHFVKAIFLSGCIFSMFSCGQHASKQQAKFVDSTRLEKFEPADGKVIVFAGQELEAIGGTDEYHDGYFDHFPAAGGFTAYTDILPGHQSFAYKHKGLDGVYETVDWGDGPENMSLLLNDSAFSKSCLAIGLDISQGNDSLVAKGKADTMIIALGDFLLSLKDRPVFLRVGYEFDGFDWNHYTKENYIPAFRRIRHMLDSMKVNNTAYVWQSKGAGTTPQILNDFYPGDDYVDWCAYSFFTPAEEHHPMIQFAREHKKPLFLAESSTVLLDEKGVCLPLDLTKQTDVDMIWDKWFTALFRTIHDNPDVIKAVHYINSNWKSRPMWKNNPYFKNIDARITQNDSMKARWQRTITQPQFLNASDTLFSYLWQDVR